MTLHYKYLFNFKIVNDTIDNTILEIDKHINFGLGSKTLSCINPHSLVISNSDKKFKNALATCDFLLPDGIGIVIASKLISNNKIQRITGPDIFQALMTILNQSNGKKVLFLGSDTNTLKKVELQMGIKYPNIILSCTYSPPFKEDFTDKENNEIIELVNYHKPDVLWVGMTAPKQEKWVYSNSNLLNVKFIGSVGAVFDYFAGTIKPPPKWISKYGLQWAHRLFYNPRKLWKRTLISGPRFLLIILKNILTKKPSL